MAAHKTLPSRGVSRQEHWSGLPFPSPMHESEKWKWSCSVVSNSLPPHGLQPTRLLHPLDFSGKSTGVGCHWVGLKLNIQKTKIMVSGPITPWQMDRETVETVTDFIGGGLQNHCRWWLQPWNEKTLAPWKKSYDQPRQHIKKQRHCFANKGPSSQSYGFSSSHVWMWKLDYKESWVPKNWCFWTVVLAKTLESPLYCRSNHSTLKEINPEYLL